jgi:hypothetical protein
MRTLTFANINPFGFIDIYDDYVKGIGLNSSKNFFIDYRKEYISFGKKRFETKILNLIEDNKIEIVFFILNSEDLTFDIQFVKEIEKKCFIVMNFFDTENFFEEIDRYYAQLADLIILPDYKAKYLYELYDMYAICTFSLYDRDKYKYLNLNRDIDVSFVGDINKSNRREYINYLRENGIKVEVFGQNTENGIIPFEKMIEIFNRSKINLNFTSYDFRALLSKNINQRVKQSKGRPIEISLCNSFCLSEKSTSIEYMFDIGKDIDIFYDKKSLLDKIEFYLSNFDKIETISNSAYSKAIEKYSVENGFKSIFDLIKNMKKREKYLILDGEFMDNFITFRFYYITRAILNLNFSNFKDEFILIAKHRRIYIRNSFIYIFKGLSDYLNRFPKFKQLLKNWKNIYLRKE